MNTIETLRAAQDKLKTQYELTLTHVVGRWDNSEEPQEVTGSHGAAGEFWSSDCADLVVTLHATIDAQLAILTAARVEEEEAEDYWAEQGKPHLRGPAKIVPVNRAALELARAILGETP